MLRHRILLIFTLGIGLLALALTWTAAQRDRLIEEQVSALATRGQSAVWRERTDVEALALTALADEIASSPSLAATLADGDRDDVATAIAVTLPEVAARTSVFEIVDAAGRQLYSEAERLEGRRPLDLGTLADVIGGRRVTGLRQDGPDRFLILHAFPLALPDGRTVAVTIGGDAAPILRDLRPGARRRRLSRQPARPRRHRHRPGPLGAGRADDPPPPRQLRAPGARRPALHPDRGAGRRPRRRTGRARRDPARRDRAPRSSSSTSAGSRSSASGSASSRCFSACTSTSAAPSGRSTAAIDVLDALARGDTSVRMEARGQAEIGRIAAAVARFRRHLVELGELRLQADRRATRQERLIRARMKDLAGALDDTARAEIVALLDQEAPAVAEDAPSDLALLANVLQLLSRRITEQHRRLTDMIEDLREAIVTRARLAGITQELEIARQLQASLLPDSFPDVPGFAVEAG